MVGDFRSLFSSLTTGLVVDETWGVVDVKILSFPQNVRYCDSKQGGRSPSRKFWWQEAKPTVFIAWLPI